MGLFANRWRTLREAAPDGVASLHVQGQELPVQQVQERQPTRPRRRRLIARDDHE